MKKLNIILPLIISIFLFTGCELNSLFGPSKEELALKEKELTNQQILKEKELNAKIELDKNSLAVKKDLELAKINKDLEKEKMVKENLAKENEYKLQSQEQANAIEIQRYYIILAGFVLLVISAALFVYFNNRRKDKLKAYEDNLEKYFRQKENQARIEVANKIIDTIASGKLNQDQEQRLLSTINGNTQTSNEVIKQVDEEQVMELEVIEHTTKDDKKKNKKKDKKKKESKKSK